jgi:hypothetical protein
MQDELTAVQKLIAQECEDLAQFLIKKNRSYGNSAIEPLRIFSRASAREAILVRLDDKLNRIIKGTGYAGDDDIRDLQGYLTLLRVLDRIEGEKNDS